MTPDAPHTVAAEPVSRETITPEAVAPETVPTGAPLDRTISPIAGRLSHGARGKALAFAGLLAGCATVAVASWRAEQPRPDAAPPRPARQVVAFEPAVAPTLARPGPDAPRLDDGSPTVPAIDPAANAPQPAAEAGPPTQARPAPLMVYSRGQPLLAPDGPAAPMIPALAGAETELDQLRRGSRIGRATARPVGDRNFLILAGATIPCILQTAIDTSTAGYVTCLIGADIYSDNGAVILLDKGARVLGEYRAGLRQGQRRVFVLWTRAVTPRGIAIDLASPAADALGRGGFDGAIDTRFWDRFGAALLLSVVDDGAYALAGRNDRSASTRLPSDAAALAVQGAADIGPTLRKAQGSEVTIQVAQDFDFSGVYGLKAHAP